MSMRESESAGGRATGDRPEGATIRHVAAMPFPARLGTQAYIQATAEGQLAAGDKVKVLTYARGAGASAIDAVLERPANFTPEATPRPGPTLGKLRDDFVLWRALRHVPPATQTLAHHLEACLICALTAHRPFTYVAHTCLEEELPTYLPTWVRQQANRTLDKARLRNLFRQPARLFCRSLIGTVAQLGGGLDTIALRLADECKAVSPALGHRLGIPALALPDWPPPSEQRAAQGGADNHRRDAEDPTAAPTKRQVARTSLALPPSAPLLAYFGNLDGYQGAEVLSEVIGQLPTAWSLLLMTDSPPPAWANDHPQRVFYRRLTTMRRRALGYAAADVVIVTRECGAGIPIKLLDALAQGMPVVAQARALAGFTELAQLDGSNLTVVAHSTPRSFFASDAKSPSQESAKALAAATLKAFRERPPQERPEGSQGQSELQGGDASR